MRTKLSRLVGPYLLPVVLSFAASCTCQNAPGADAGLAERDTGADTGADTGSDTGAHTGNDAGTDVGSDEVHDTTQEIPPPDPGEPACQPPKEPIPEANSPCTTEGQSRCSDKDERVLVLERSSLRTISTCVRPHIVVCTRTRDQGLLWVLQECALGAPSSCYRNGLEPPSCQENERGAFCCPVFLHMDAGGGDIPTCRPSETGIYWCQGELLTCTFIENASIAAYGRPALFQECGHLAQNCLYWVATEKCPILHDCWPGAKSFSECVEDGTSPPHCREECPM